MLVATQQCKIEPHFWVRTGLCWVIFSVPHVIGMEFVLLGFIPCKAEQPLQGLELQEKEAQKD